MCAFVCVHAFVRVFVFVYLCSFVRLCVRCVPVCACLDVWVYVWSDTLVTMPSSLTNHSQMHLLAFGNIVASFSKISNEDAVNFPKLSFADGRPRLLAPLQKHF